MYMKKYSTHEEQRVLVKLYKELAENIVDSLASMQILSREYVIANETNASIDNKRVLQWHFRLALQRHDISCRHLRTINSLSSDEDFLDEKLNREIETAWDKIWEDAKKLRLSFRDEIAYTEL